MKSIRIAFAIILLLSVAARSQAHPAREIVLLTWNVENLFDWEDDPENPGDDEFTPRSWRYWSEKRYRRKLANLAEILAQTGADFIGLQEIENRRVLEDLTQVLRHQHDRDYPYIIHRDGPDHRGIDVALLAMHPPVATSWFTPVPEQRDVLQAIFSPYGKPITIFVNHWKSRWGGKEKTNALRLQQGAAVRAAVETLLETNPDAAIVVMGDFNDNHHDVSLTQGLRSVLSTEAFLSATPPGPLLNLHALLPESERPTYYFRRGKYWNDLDSMHASRSMISSTLQPQWKVVLDSYQVLRDCELLDEWGYPKSFRRVTHPDTGERFYQYGYSDHLPVRAILRLTPTAAPDAP